MNNEKLQTQAKDNNYANNYKKRTMLIFVISVSVFTIVVLSFLISLIFRAKNSIIEDTNGISDFSLNTITENEIKETKFSNFSSFLSGHSDEGKHSDVDDFRLDEADYDYTYNSAKSFSGIMIANVTKTDKENLTLEIKSAVESGNFSVYVYIEDELYCDVNINSTETVNMSGISNKTVYVKVAGEDAKMKIDVTRIIED